MVEISYTRVHKTTGESFSQSANAVAGQDIAHLPLRRQRDRETDKQHTHTHTHTYLISAGIVSTFCYCYNL